MSPLLKNSPTQPTDRAGDAEVLVRVEGVSKIFCRDLKRSLIYGLQDSVRDLTSWGTSSTRPSTKDHVRALRAGEFLAVDNVSFELRRGECLGLIGRNGAGKTTLLKMLNGLIKPDSGLIEIRGRVGALIALGAGFNPILSGRENVYVNGSILGLTKDEIDAKMDDIIDFAEIREFMDSPVQSYSSGMQVRLGFAVATAVDPDILILDEVLAVGDAAFRAKCYNRIGILQKRAAIIFVSHSMQQVSQICDTLLMLKKGKVTWFGDSVRGVAEYTNENCGNTMEGEKTLIIEAPITRANLSFSPVEMDYGGILIASLNLELEEAMEICSARISVYSSEGLVVAEWNSKRAKIPFDLPSGKSRLEFQIGPLNLGPGTYHLAFVLNDSTGVLLPFWSLKNHSLIVTGDLVGSSEYQVPHHDYKIVTE
jgi:lipopolysaccharide transport system ATP-binding protein